MLSVLKALAGLAGLIVLAALCGASGSNSSVMRSAGRRPQSGGCSVWTVGHGGKKVGSWSSFRHR